MIQILEVLVTPTTLGAHRGWRTALYFAPERGAPLAEVAPDESERRISTGVVDFETLALTGPRGATSELRSMMPEHLLDELAL